MARLGWPWARDLPVPEQQEIPAVRMLQGTDEYGIPDSFGGDALGFHLLSQQFSQAPNIGIFGKYPTRSTAVQYITLHRCVQLVSTAVAQLICNGGIRVVTRDGYNVDNRRTKYLLDVMCETLDGGQSPAFQFWSDMAVDYLLEGNGLIVPTFTNAGMLTGARRFEPRTATTTTRRTYHMIEAETDDHGAEYFDALEVIHSRWPLMQGNNYTSRRGFALSPILLLRNAVQVGLSANQYVQEWYGAGTKTRTHLDYAMKEAEQDYTLEQKQEIKKWIKLQSRSQDPLVTFGATSTPIDETPQDSQMQALREFQVQETCRFYGLPLPLVSVNIRQWGAAVNEQIAKLGYRWGVKMHSDSILAALGLRFLRRGERFQPDPMAFVMGDTEGMKDLIMATRGDQNAEPIATGPELRKFAGLPREPDGEYIPSPTPPTDGGQSE